VKNLILKEIKEATYFSILLDIIPNVSHTDQMAFVVRYVKAEESEAQIKESFLNFLPLHGKTAEEITNSILNEPHENVLDVMMCKGQVYDNASTMSGINSVTKRRKKEINSKAKFVLVATTRSFLWVLMQWNLPNSLMSFHQGCSANKKGVETHPKN